MKVIQMTPKQGYAKPDNYAAFYGLLKQMPGAGKEEIVLQFTNGRTTVCAKCRSTNTTKPSVRWRS